MASITRTITDEQPLAAAEASDAGGVDLTVWAGHTTAVRNLTIQEARDLAGELVTAAEDADHYATTEGAGA